jgi:hypothetical protein
MSAATSTIEAANSMPQTPDNITVDDKDSESGKAEHDDADDADDPDVSWSTIPSNGSAARKDFGLVD